MDKDRKLHLLAAKKLAEAIFTAIAKDDRIARIVNDILEEGLETSIFPEATISFRKIEPQQMLLALPAPKPLVGNDGNVTPDMFDSNDREFFRQLKITIDSPHA